MSEAKEKAEVGPALRLAYGDQPRNERLYIATEDMADGCNGYTVFVVNHAMDGLWLSGNIEHSEKIWNTEDRLVFKVTR